MSTIKTDTLQNVAGTLSVPVGTVVNGSAKAWVNFNGTGTVAIRAAFNVSSITDNNVGDYTINFTTAMPDANYVLAGDAAWNQSNIFAGVLTTTIDSTRTASAIRVRCENISGNGQNPSDSPFVCIAIFR
jgi:hypothetical protein